MSIYFKPVVWNEYGYLRPGGGRFAVGYPAENGFGHEEWNNSPRYRYQRDGESFRVFHTEGLGAQDLDANAGRIVLMMIASYNSGQFLVAMAGGCTSLFGDEHKSTRLALLRQLGLDNDDRPDEAWSLPRVKEAFGGDYTAFMRKWRKELHYLPTWTCPEALYLPLRTPVQLDAAGLTGKQRLVNRYSSYQSASRATALRVLDTIPLEEGEEKIALLKAFCGDADGDIETDLAEIEESGLPATTRAALVQARLGQGKFRDDLLDRWGGKCAVTGCDVGEMLKASHIRPWKRSDNGQRLDPDNGLLLSADIDALFDRGLVSFDDSGRLIVSAQVKGRLPTYLERFAGLRVPPSPQMKVYLRYHRTEIYRSS